MTETRALGFPCQVRTEVRKLSEKLSKVPWLTSQQLHLNFNTILLIDISISFPPSAAISLRVHKSLRSPTSDLGLCQLSKSDFDSSANDDDDGRTRQKRRKILIASAIARIRWLKQSKFGRKSCVVITGTIGRISWLKDTHSFEGNQNGSRTAPEDDPRLLRTRAQTKNR